MEQEPALDPISVNNLGINSGKISPQNKPKPEVIPWDQVLFALKAQIQKLRPSHTYVN
jgi:hypothetical protein